MKIEKAQGRDKKRNKKRYGMRVTGRSVFTTQEVLMKKGQTK